MEKMINRCPTRSSNTTEKFSIRLKFFQTLVTFLKTETEECALPMAESKSTKNPFYKMSTNKKH